MMGGADGLFCFSYEVSELCSCKYIYRITIYDKEQSGPGISEFKRSFEIFYLTVESDDPVMITLSSY